jgi:saccharopine dehydrogenase-like NADP-dependent oxidoreductase
MPHIKNMKEKTLRYPGHVAYIQVLKQSGFFNEKPIHVNGTEISPLDFTSKILFDEWKLGETEAELTVMRITIIGEDAKGTQKKIVYNLHDEYCSETKTSSMARTTGYTATAAANMFLDGLFSEKGVFPPELIGDKKGVFEYILKYLKERNVIYTKLEN